MKYCGLLSPCACDFQTFLHFHAILAGMTAIGEISLSLRFPSNKALLFLSYPQLSANYILTKFDHFSTATFGQNHDRRNPFRNIPRREMAHCFLFHFQKMCFNQSFVAFPPCGYKIYRDGW